MTVRQSFRWTPFARNTDGTRPLCAEIVNLRQVRKRRKREISAQTADENRARHGRTKAQKTLEDTLRQKTENALNQGRRERPDGSDPS
nr:DUF4169 family protein [Martelella mediterranea]